MGLKFVYLNRVLFNIQNIVKPIYDRSYVLQHIDWLIGANFFLLIFASTFVQSDYIGYMAVFAITLTIIKLLTKPDEKFLMNTGDKFLLIYFLLTIISLAGSSLIYLSFKGFIKTLTYLGFYVSVVHYLKDNKNMLKYIILSIAISASAEALIGIHQNFLSVGEISGWQDMSRLNPEEVMTRVYGTLDRKSVV